MSVKRNLFFLKFKHEFEIGIGYLKLKKEKALMLAVCKLFLRKIKYK